MNKKILILIVFLAVISTSILVTNLTYAVTAAPNKAEITAEVLDVESTTYANNEVSKLQLKIIDYKNIEGGITNPGEIEAIAYHKNNNVLSLLEIKKGDKIEAVISLEGDEWGTQWQATEVKVIKKGESTALPNSGLLPDSPFYFLKSWKESIQTFFTFGAENKAKQYLHLAEVRLAEYQKMVEKGKTEIAEKTLKKYEKQLNNALQKTEELKNKGEDIKDLSQKIEDAVTKHLEILQENLQKVPEQAKKGIENAIENSQKQIEKMGGKKDETADWKTYRNEQYGFEVKYPKDWNHSSDVMAENFGKRFVKDSNEFVCNTLISMIQTEKFDEYSRTAYPSERQRTAIKINDISAVKIESHQDLGFYGDYLIKRTDGVKFSVQITQMIEKFIVNKDGDKVAYGTVNDPNCINVFNQILSTFKFTPLENSTP